MLTRFVRTQLVLFTIASIVGVAVMVFAYIQLPTLLGIGRLTVTMELPASGGLYQFANVPYRGVQIGKVREVRLTENGAEATLSLDTSPKVPADLQARLQSHCGTVFRRYPAARPQARRFQGDTAPGSAEEFFPEPLRRDAQPLGDCLAGVRQRPSRLRHRN